MKLTAAAIYWVIVAIWLAVLATIVISYIRDRKKFGAARTLLCIVAIDTLRNLIENCYFGLYFGSQYGFFASGIADVLGDPRLLIIPKIINVIAASIVLWLMALTWLPKDIRRRQEAEREIHETSEALRHETEERRRLFESSIDLIMITDRQGNIVRVSPSVFANLGYLPAELAGQSAVRFIYPGDLASTRLEMRSARKGRHTRNFVTRYFHKDGRLLTFNWSGVWSEAEQKHFFSGRDVTEQKEAEDKLKYLAHVDQLTGLPNRVTLQEDLDALFGGGKDDFGAGAYMSIALIGLDGFKDVNETFGQTVGDELLRAIAARLAETARGKAAIYRVNGDEFAAVLAGERDPIVLADVVAKLLRAVAEPIEIGGQRLFVGASAGLAIAPNDGKTVDELIANAGLALHEAKAAGGGTHRLFVPMLRAQAQARRALDVELRRAFGDHEFELFYQPQVRLSDGAIVGAEALLRWRHPERGLVGPGAFIDALARNAISLDVGRWVLQAACDQAVRWQHLGPEPLRMGVNIFPAQLQQQFFLEDVEKALRLSGLPHPSLEIEITENIALSQDDKIIEPLRALRQRGISLAFDDFGTGYASLSYLRRYPLSRIKIDKSFVQKIGQTGENQDAAIVRSIITMGHNLGLEIIAEGVETEAQAEFLRREQCDEAQGFLYAKPMPAREFETLLMAPRKVGSLPAARAS
jgi:diguanylate cyclase (GGDEF)-like protein/PAS domain S-box-containing protein